MTQELALTAQTINEEYQAAKSSAVDSANRIVRVGQMLTEVKEDLPHGEFGKWVDENCDFKVRAAQRMMKAAAKASSTTHLTETDARQFSQLVWQNDSGEVEKVDADDAMRDTASPPTQDEADVRTIRKAFELIAEVGLPADEALERFGIEAFGDKASYACDWIQAFTGALMQSGMAIRLENGFYSISAADIELWEETYSIDVKAELKKIIAWNEANPDRRKTKRGIRRHINQWLSNADQKAEQFSSSKRSTFDDVMEGLE